MEAKRVYIPVLLRAADNLDPETREFPFVITSESKDSYRTVFKADGWKMERFIKHPVVFFQHRSSSPDPDDLIARSTKLYRDGNTWVSNTLFETEDVNPKAEKLRKKLLSGTPLMASIGADVTKYRMGDASKDEDPEAIIFEEQELFEYSIVTLGSNPDATIKRNDEVFKQIRSELSENSDTSTETEKPKGLSVMRARLELYKSKKF